MSVQQNIKVYIDRVINIYGYSGHTDIDPSYKIVNYVT